MAMAAAEQAPVTGDLRLPDRPGMYRTKTRKMVGVWAFGLANGPGGTEGSPNAQIAMLEAAAFCAHLAQPAPAIRGFDWSILRIPTLPCHLSDNTRVIWLLSWLSRDQGTRLSDEVACACPCHWKGRHNAKVGATHAGFKL